jgi:hypothetical protein
MKSPRDPLMQQEKRATALSASLTNTLTECVELDFSPTRSPGFPETEAGQFHGTVRWAPDLCCSSCGLMRRKVYLEPFDREILQCPDCDLGRLDRNDLMEGVIVLLSVPILIAIIFLALHIP